MVKSKKGKPRSGSGTSGTRAGNTNQPARIRGRRWCFTWNNYQEQDIIRINQFLSTSCQKAVYGKEIAPTTGMAHLQGYLECANPIDLNALKSFDKAIHWEKAKGSDQQNWVYCTKDKDFASFGNWPEKVKDPLEGKELRDWQVELEAYLNGPVHDREVRWYYDPVGNAGKSTWTKHWLLNHDDAMIVGGAADNIKCAIALLQKNGKTLPKTVIWDIPRSQEHISYNAMEEIKNGLIFSGKYESGQVLMNIPHLVVFSNHLPDQSKLSADRWCIKTLSSLVF